MRMVPLSVLSALLLLPFSGCTSTPPPVSGKEARVANIEVLSNGALRLDGKPTSMNAIGDDLKKAGYLRPSPIEIHSTSSLSPKFQKSIGETLTKAGFYRFMFVGPRKATVVVQQNTPTAPTKPVRR